MTEVSFGDHLRVPLATLAVSSQNRGWRHPGDVWTDAQGTCQRQVASSLGGPCPLPSVQTHIPGWLLAFQATPTHPPTWGWAGGAHYHGHRTQALVSNRGVRLPRFLGAHNLELSHLTLLKIHYGQIRVTGKLYLLPRKCTKCHIHEYVW